MGEVAWAHPPASAPTRETWGLLAGKQSSPRRGRPRRPQAVSHCASLLSRELAAQVPACASRPHPLCFPVGPAAPGPEPGADRRQARARSLETEIRTQILAGLWPLRIYHPGKGLVPRGRHVGSSTWRILARPVRPRHAGRQARSAWVGTGPEGSLPGGGNTPSKQRPSSVGCVPEVQVGSGVWGLGSKAVRQVSEEWGCPGERLQAPGSLGRLCTGRKEGEGPGRGRGPDVETRLLSWGCHTVARRLGGSTPGPTNALEKPGLTRTRTPTRAHAHTLFEWTAREARGALFFRGRQPRRGPLALCCSGTVTPLPLLGLELGSSFPPGT